MINKTYRVSFWLLMREEIRSTFSQKPNWIFSDSLVIGGDDDDAGLVTA